MSFFLRPNLFTTPISAVYSTGIFLRNWTYDSGLIKVSQSLLPVISIGNLNIGGSGKSPFAGFVANGLFERGLRPVILSRGYGGKFAGPYQVQERNSAAEVGDEALMHFLHLKGKANVVVARRRVEGVRFIERHNLGDVIILDDGLQHRALARDLNIVLVDVTQATLKQQWWDQKLLPAGTLREHVSPALKRIDCVVAVQRTIEKGTEISTYEQTSLNLLLTPGAFIDLYSGEETNAEILKDKPAIAVTAIASAKSFFMMLGNLGINSNCNISFGDHHLFSLKDWQEVTQVIPNGIIIVTEKDAVKVRQYVDGPGKVYALKLTVKFASEVEDQHFWQLIRSKIMVEEQIQEKFNA